MLIAPYVTGEYIVRAWVVDLHATKTYSSMLRYGCQFLPTVPRINVLSGFQLRCAHYKYFTVKQQDKQVGVHSIKTNKRPNKLVVSMQGAGKRQQTTRVKRLSKVRKHCQTLQEHPNFQNLPNLPNTFAKTCKNTENILKQTPPTWHRLQAAGVGCRWFWTLGHTRSSPAVLWGGQGARISSRALHMTKKHIVSLHMQLRHLSGIFQL